MGYRKVIGILAATVVVLCAGVGDGAWFMPLPQLPGATQTGEALALSADGSTIVGTSHDGTAFHAVRWTVGGEIQKLGAGGSSFAWAVSADGKVVAGNWAASTGQEAFRWTTESGPVGLGYLPGGTLISNATDMSADCSVFVGFSRSTQGLEAFRWSAVTGMVGLGTIPGGEFGSRARGVSSDGSVIIGDDRTATGVQTGDEAFRWTVATELVSLGDLPGGINYSSANDVSADGAIVVGRSVSNDSLFPSRAFWWTAETGMNELPDVPGIGPTAFAEGVSGDGVVIVGGASDGLSGFAFAWDEANGSRSVRDLLRAQGVDVGGWQIQVARKASYDGLTIIGLGINPSGVQQPWAARFDAGTFVPEPSSIALSAAGVVAWLASLRVVSRAA